MAARLARWAVLVWLLAAPCRAAREITLGESFAYEPTPQPTLDPPTSSPSFSPTPSPSATAAPTTNETYAPTVSSLPSGVPTPAPSPGPTAAPTNFVPDDSYADLALKSDYSALDGPGQHLLHGIFLGATIARQTFETQFAQDIARAINVSVSRVYVLNISVRKNKRERARRRAV